MASFKASLESIFADLQLSLLGAHDPDEHRGDVFVELDVTVEAVEKGTFSPAKALCFFVGLSSVS